MKCRLKAITEYPFPIEKEQSPIPLTYTVLASPSTCQTLHIITYGFRFLNDILILILSTDKHECKQDLHIHLESMEALDRTEILLYAPLSIIKTVEGKDIQLSERSLSLSTLLLPQLPIATKLFVYINQEESTLIETIIQKDSFIVNPGYCYVDAKWLNTIFREDMHWKAITQLKFIYQKPSQTYLKIYFELRNDQQQQIFQQKIFKKGVTKLEFIKEPFHPKSQYKVNTKHLKYKKILNIYNSFIKKIPLQKSYLCILQSKEDMGVDIWLESIATQSNLQFQQIDCQQYVSSKMFYEKIRNISALSNHIILISHVNWLQKVYKIEQNHSVDLKTILSQIQTNFKQVQETINRRFILVIATPTPISREIFYSNVNFIELILPKQSQKMIFKYIFNSIDSEYDCTQLIEQIKDKIGWQKFQKVLFKKWSKLRTLTLEKIIKTLVPDTQNVISVSWDDVGGLQMAKEEIIQTILLPRHHPQIFDDLIRPRTGLLFYGPPGTGKTLLGKCIAKECKMSFISVKGPELLNMYVGESEKNVRKVFERAAVNAPCIVFMDELDALLPKRGNSGDSNQVMDRIVAELMTQMDKAGTNNIFVIGATNRPDLLDPSILRAGRFDKQIYLGICADKESQVKILKAQTRSLKLEEGFCFENIVENIQQQYTGADFYALTSKATQIGIDRCIETYERQGTVKEIILKEDDFKACLPLIKPSVTREDLKKYEELKNIYY